MDYKRIIPALLLAAAIAAPATAAAQGEDKSLPLHFELSSTLGSKYKEILPLGVSLDAGLSLSKVLSVHLNLDNSFYVHNNAMTSGYNSIPSLGGGVGVALFPDSWDHGKLELRGFVNGSLKKSDWKNKAYNFGLYWYGNSTRVSPKPVVGIGYTVRDFSNKSLPTYNSFYASFGVRF